MRNILKTDSIDSLIYKWKRGEFRGYRRDLLTEETPDNIKKFILCSQCEGISRKPKLPDGKTFCSPCSPVKNMIVDSRVDEIVLQLKSRCPLSTRGCDWLGQLGDIEQHMRVCEKLWIDCEIGCGEVLERWETDEHLKKCPLRREKCEFCGEEVEASKANRHIALCPKHPDGEVLCPYKELGCDLLRIQRKNLDTHLADNSIGHQELLLKEIHQLRNAAERKECDNSKKLQYLKGRDVLIHKRVWMLLAVAVLGIAILVSYLHTERDRIHVHEQSIQSNKQSIESNELETIVNTLKENIYTAIQFNKGLEWEIKGVRDKFEKKKKLYSDPFYVNNYKFQGSAYFNSRDNNQFGIYLCLCVGLLDDSLKWPFLGKVTTTLVNLESSDNYITKFYLTEGLDMFNRRTKDGSEVGFDFTTEEEVLEKFSKDDSIRIKIEIEYLNKPDEFTKRITS